MNDVLFHSPATVLLILKLINLNKANQISVQLQYGFERSKIESQSGGSQPRFVTLAAIDKTEADLHKQPMM